MQSIKFNKYQMMMVLLVTTSKAVHPPPADASVYRDHRDREDVPDRETNDEIARYHPRCRHKRGNDNMYSDNERGKGSRNRVPEIHCYWIRDDRPIMICESSKCRLLQSATNKSVNNQIESKEIESSKIRDFLGKILPKLGYI